MNGRATARTQKAKGYHSNRGVQEELPDIVSSIPDVGSILLTQSEGLTSGMIAGSHMDPKIMVSIYKVDPHGGEFAGLGMFTTLTPEEARWFGESLIDMANGGLDSVKPD